MRARHPRQLGKLSAREVGDIGSSIVGASKAVSVTATSEPDARLLEAWDALVRATEGSDVSQLSAWARTRSAVGFASTYLLAFEEDTLVAGAQVLHRHVPAVGRFGYVSYGPVIGAGTQNRAAICGALSDALHELSTRTLRALFVQPPDNAGEMTEELLSRGFRNSDAGVAPPATLRLDLTLPEAELRRGLSRRLRRWTNHWEQRGVRVRGGDERDVPMLARLMESSAGHQGYDSLPVDYLLTLWRSLAPADHVQLFVGEVNGAPVVASLFTVCGRTVRYRLTGLDRSSEASNLSVPAAVVWHAALWSKRTGHHWFDFGGIGETALQDLLADRTPDETTWRSTDTFKARFGGRPHVYPTAVERIGPWWLRTLYDASRRSPHGRALLAHARQLLRIGRGPR